MAGTLDFALSYAEGGFPVIPLHSPVDGACSCRRPDCDSPAKHPRTRNGLTGASTDPDQIRAWWEMWPTANVGVAIPDGYVVVDIDVEGASAATNGHDMPPTAFSKTGRGWHFLYRTSTPVRPAVAVLPHVDLRGPGSYIVAPPSRHISGAEYAWVVSPKEGVADAPAWIPDADRPSVASSAVVGEVIPAGARNATLTRLAGAMRHQGMTADEMTAALLVVNAGRVVPPLDDDEIRDIARSIARYEPGEQGPRVVLGGPSHLVATALADIEPREPRELRYGRWDQVDHSLVFGDGGTGKGILTAHDVARLSADGEIVLILDYERHAEYEWRPRVEAFRGDLSRVFVIHPEAAIWDCADEVVALVAQLDVTWVFVDSVAYACLGMEVEKSVTATRYSAAIAKVPVPVVSLAHTTKADADPKHPFGSVFWSNGARVTIGMSAPDETRRVLKNRKTNQRSPFPPVEIDWSWSETGTLPARLTERRAVVTLADRAWDALGDGPLRSEALLATVNDDGGQPTTLGSLKPILSRSPRFESTPDGWQRTPVRGAVRLKIGDNGTRAEAHVVSDNGTDNERTDHERDADNEPDNTLTTGRSVVSVPPLRGQLTTAQPTFDERFAELQATAWSTVKPEPVA
jgi:Bifunctional DNA primase/polymerase, N-terminal/Primase C terminal 1 (PriCT-1)